MDPSSQRLDSSERNRRTSTPDVGLSSVPQRDLTRPAQMLRRPSIRLLSSSTSSAVPATAVPAHSRRISNRLQPERSDHVSSSRRRSSSEPQRPSYASIMRGTEPAPSSKPHEAMAPVVEEPLASGNLASNTLPVERKRGRFRSASVSAKSMFRLPTSARQHNQLQHRGTAASRLEEYNSGVVNLLDVVDPEISTLTTLTNVQNSLFVPDLGWLVNRAPSYTLTPRDSESAETHESPSPPRESSIAGEKPDSKQLGNSNTIDSNLSSSRYAVLPDGFTLDGWDPSDMWEINDHVRHMLHSRRSKFKRGLKGFWKYVQKPLGFLVTLYATLITLFGLAWVLFLIGWINVGGRQLYIINVIDHVLVALFAVVGDGLAPFRAVDTYHMIYIAHYHRLARKLRAKQPPLNTEINNKSSEQPNQQLIEADSDLEKGGAKDMESNEYFCASSLTKKFYVLTPTQQRKLTHHAGKFAKSHTFYKPHETSTHFAFPIRILIAVVLLLDFHSIFQIALGACTWAIDYRVRPVALTTVLLCCSISCNIAAGILIMVGDRTTRKTEVIKKIFRQQLTGEAIAKVRRKKRKQEGLSAERERVIIRDEITKAEG
ncbi:hypothetical protein FQN57_000424 [Myotisia sp. PD_48]|nr:hypothetical protein FQN57_000424 [Myotisia sp. PD_48]